MPKLTGFWIYLNTFEKSQFMEFHFDTIKQSRKYVATIVGKLNNEQLNCIPPGFKNNIGWHLLHLVVTEQLLCYRLSGLPCSVSEEWIDRFMKGTAPTEIIDNTLVQDALDHLIKQPEQLRDDYHRGIFKNYSSYTTSADVTLNSIEDAIVFNTFHEGIHLGIMLQL